MKSSLRDVKSFELTTHKDRIKALALSQDSNLLITGAYDGQIIIWNAKRECKIQNIKTSGFVFCVAISKNNEEMVAGITEGNINYLDIYHINSCKRLARLEGHKETIYSVVICKKDKYIASASLDTTIRIWDRHTFELITIIEAHKECVRTLTFDSASNYLFSGSYDKTIKRWNLETKKAIKTYKGHDDLILGIDIASNDSFLVSCSRDKSMKIWSVESGKVLKTLTGHFDDVWTVKISLDMRYIISGGKDSTIGIWKKETSNCIRVIKAHVNGVTAVALSNSNRILYSAGMDGLVKIWYLDDMLVHKYRFTLKELKSLIKERNTSGITTFIEGLIETEFSDLEIIEKMLIEYKNSKPEENSEYLHLLFYAYKQLDKHEDKYHNKLSALRELFEDPLFQIYLNKQIVQSSSSINILDKEHVQMCKIIKDKLQFKDSLHARIIDHLLIYSEDKFYSARDVYDIVTKASSDIASSSKLMDYYIILLDHFYAIEAFTVFRKNVKKVSPHGLSAILNCFSDMQDNPKAYLKTVYGNIFDKYMKSNTKTLTNKFYYLFDKMDKLKMFLIDLALFLTRNQKLTIENSKKVLIVDFYHEKLRKLSPHIKTELNWFTMLDNLNEPEPHIVLACFESLFAMLLILVNGRFEDVKNGNIMKRIVDTISKNKYFIS